MPSTQATPAAVQPPDATQVEGAAMSALDALLQRSSKRTRAIFNFASAASSSLSPIPSFLDHSSASASAAAAASASATASNPALRDGLETSIKARLGAKITAEYADAKQLPAVILAQQGQALAPAKPGQPQHGAGAAGGGVAGQKRKAPSQLTNGTADGSASSLLASYIDDLEGKSKGSAKQADAAPQPGPQMAKASAGVVALRRSHSTSNGAVAAERSGGSSLSTALIRKRDAAERIAKPAYHPSWKLSRVISGHLGWVRAVAVEPGNKWFATGAGDRMIKIWDLASGDLKLTLTGHISTVRGLAVSARHPYMFSAGEDKMVKNWDLETNRVIRQYQGHLSGIYSLALHPTLDVVITAGRDAVARVWDMRSKAQVHVLSGHRGTVANVQCQDADPQVVTGSMDSTIRLWDLAAGKSITTLTHHKKSVRALAIHPLEFSFASGSAGGHNIKTWRFPEGLLINNMSHEGIVNTMSVNPDGVLFSGTDAGSLKFFDYATGTPFQALEDIPQPGSLDAEAGVFCSTFDQTGTRLITGGADKTIKIYKETA